MKTLQVIGERMIEGISLQPFPENTVMEKWYIMYKKRVVFLLHN